MDHYCGAQLSVAWPMVVSGGLIAPTIITIITIIPFPIGDGTILGVAARRPSHDRGLHRGKGHGIRAQGHVPGQR